MATVVQNQALEQPLDPAWARSVRKIAVYRALFLGDLLCATPALVALRQRFPQAEITLIGLPWAAELVDRLPCLDRLVEFQGYPAIEEVPYEPVRGKAFLAAMQAEQFDLAIQMHGSGCVSNGFVAELGAGFTLGYRSDHDDDRLDRSLLYDANEHETLRWLRLVAEVGAYTADTRLVLPTTTAEQERAHALLAAGAEGCGPLIGLHVGAKAASRRWPPERFAALGDALAHHYGARLVLTGSAGERPLTAAAQAALRSPALDVAGKTDLGTFAALVAQLDLLVTNDTGASHIAAATQTPSVVLFGPMRPQLWAPLDRQRHRVVDALALFPAADPQQVLAQLSVDTVFAVCAEALAQSGRGDRTQTETTVTARSLVFGA